jgi:hypothetical protein
MIYQIAHSAYVEISRSAYVKATSLFQQLNSLYSKSQEFSQNSDDGEIPNQYQWLWIHYRGELETHCAIAIVFAGLAVEAYIYFYGLRHSSQKLLSRIDTLRLEDKWIIFPKLAGIDFPTDRQGYELLKKLIRNRNKLVHYKAKQVEINLEALQAKINELPQPTSDKAINLLCLQYHIDQIRKDDLEKFTMASDAIRALDELAKDMLSIDPNSDIGGNFRAPYGNWFGGEPLLSIEEIQKLEKELGLSL